MSWRFLQNDIWAGLMAGVGFTFAAALNSDAKATAVARIMAASVVYFWLYLYGHTLANQLVGIEEDRVNKPERPLPSGLVTVRGTAWRLAFVVVAFLAVGHAFGVLRWAALWVATFLLLNFYGHKHWFLKNTVCMSLGTLACLGAAWELVAPMTEISWRVSLTISGFVAVTSPIQDFRDAEGDRLLNRRTLPIAIGERASRVVMSVALVAWLPVAWALMVRPSWSGGLATWLAVVAIVVLTIRVAFRLVRVHGPEEDHRTYRLHEYLYVLYAFSGVVFLSA
ncbi:MAG TPA: UbiA family prenyltransferase [Labilithrix sp.]|nr:UbiA family prenyltransferase [Labilithrix sp.]